MKTRQQKARDKQFEQERIIAQSIVDLRTQREEFEKLIKEYEDSAFEAVQLGQDEYANELLETIVEIEDFNESLKYLEVKVKTAAITAEAFSKLKELPEALKACRLVFCKGPNFQKLGKDMSSLLGSLGTARDQFREFRNSLGRNNTDPVYAEVFGHQRQVEDPKFKQRLEEKKKALEARLVAASGASSVAPAPAEQVVSASDAAKIDTIAAMLDDEKRKN